MAKIDKYHQNKVLYYIRHDLRELPEGDYGKENDSIDLTISKDVNYSLINRGNTADEINNYRLNLEKEIFKYNRTNLVHAVEIVIQCPSDCPKEQHEVFFQECHNYICSTLPMGEKCVIVSEVHRDEHFKNNEEVVLDKKGNCLSKEHLHLMFVPAVPDLKHEDYDYKLCADQLTRRSNLKAFHPGLQKHLQDNGIEGTVYNPNKKGISLGLSVKQLKELTRATGKTFEEGITVEKLAEIINENEMLKEKLAEIEATKERTWGEADWGKERTWENEF